MRGSVMRAVVAVGVAALCSAGCHEPPLIEGDAEVARLVMASAKADGYVPTRVVIEYYRGFEALSRGVAESERMEELKGTIGGEPFWQALMTQAPLRTGGLVCIVSNDKKRILAKYWLK